MKKELPLKFKNQIIKFCREYESLACPHVISIPVKISVEISWCSSDTTEIRYLNDFDVSKTKKILGNDVKIKNFCKRTDDFGRKYFKDKNWLWKNVLWNYRPELYEKFNPNKYQWIKI